MELLDPALPHPDYSKNREEVETTEAAGRCREVQGGRARPLSPGLEHRPGLGRLRLRPILHTPSRSLVAQCEAIENGHSTRSEDNASRNARAAAVRHRAAVVQNVPPAGLARPGVIPGGVTRVAPCTRCDACIRPRSRQRLDGTGISGLLLHCTGMQWAGVCLRGSGSSGLVGTARRERSLFGRLQVPRLCKGQWKDSGRTVK